MIVTSHGKHQMIYHSEHYLNYVIITGRDCLEVLQKAINVSVQCVWWVQTDWNSA
jgi:hypothetical protein